MDMIFKCKVNKNVADKFKLALMLSKEQPDDVIEKFMLQYVSGIIPDSQELDEKAAGQGYSGLEYSHKILKAFFQLERELGYVPFKDLAERCSDEVNYPEMFIQDFKQQFSLLMDPDSKPHGKIFEVADEKVVLWDCVKATLISYKDYFER